MQDVTGALADEHGDLAALLAGVDDAGWAAPSRCPGWSVSDVVLHLAQTDEMAAASVQGTFDEFVARFAAGMAPGADVDDAAGAAVERERGASGPEVFTRWQVSALALRSALAAVDPGTRVPWVAGDLAARTLATTRLAETWIHAGDVAAGLGVEVQPTDRLWHVARLAWRTLPYAFARAGRTPPGPVRFVLAAPSGDRWTFESDDAEGEVTTVTGTAVDLVTVAGQRATAGETGLRAEGPDADAVLALVRTFA